MADFYTYRRNIEAQKRRRRAVVALLAVLVLLCVAAGFFWFGRSAPAGAEVTEATPVATATIAPLETPAPATVETAAYNPQRLLPAVDTAAWDTAAAVTQTIDHEYLNTDARMVGLPALGTLANSYFDTATFLGDSITEGLEAYDSGANNATVLGYRSAGPNTVVNGAVVHDYTRNVDEVPLEALAASAPDRVYVMFGTNSLVTQGNEDSFIAYYERMIDMMREVLAPGVPIYVQAVLPVQEYVVNTTPGLDNDRIRTVNNLLANMALRKGCYFLNLPEIFTNTEGSQLDEYEGDGIHMVGAGYRAWYAYLTTHAAWDRRNTYQGRDPLYILGT